DRSRRQRLRSRQIPPSVTCCRHRHRNSRARPASRQLSGQNPLGCRADHLLVTQLSSIAYPLRAPRFHPRSFPEAGLPHHLLATSPQLILLTLLSPRSPKCIFKKALSPDARSLSEWYNISP